jgi:FtsZ-interacting cell division protein ZipA
MMEAKVNPTLLVIIVVVVVLVLLGFWITGSRARRAKLQSQFGPEYQRTLEASTSRHEAEHELAARRKRVEAFNLRALAPNEQKTFADRWRAAQAKFVDDPAQAIGIANNLVMEVMRARGYPMGDFEQQAADLSVDHANVVDNYRAAQALVVKNDQRLASTEDLRQAMVHFRALFDDLLGNSETVLQKEVAR